MKVSTASYEARLADVIAKGKDVLQRRWKMLAAVTLLVTALGVGATFLLKPYYQGIARLQIDPKQNPLNHTGNDAQAQLGSEAIETEVSVINSLDTARQVVRRLKLDQDPEFYKPATSGPALSADQKVDAAANQLSKVTDVAREKLTYIIAIKVASLVPEKSAKIANEFTSAYMDGKVGIDIGTAARQAAFFDQQLTKMGDDARQADEKIAKFEAENGIVRSSSNKDGETITEQQVAPLAMQLATSEALSAEMRAKHVAAQRQLAVGKPDAITEVRNSVTIQDLRRQRALQVQTLTDMANRYGPRYPDYIKASKQLSDIDQQLQQEQLRVVQSLRADADAADAQAGSLRASMARLEAKQTADARASVTLASLQRDADSKHAAYDRMAATTMDARQAAQNSMAQARVIDVAKVPMLPYWPRRDLMVLVSLVLGLGIGVGVITAQELMVTGMMTVAQVEDELGLPLITAIPLLRGNDMPADMLMDKPTSQFAEALRNARATLMGVKGEIAPKIIAMTSSLPSEGKTTTALALARTMALNGQRTIIVDVDVRRAQMRNIIDADVSGPGTVELLRGETTLDEAIQPTRLELLHSIAVQKPYFTSDNLFGTQAIHDILEGLSARYDVVILDLPPLVGLADGRFLAALADATVLAIRWSYTPMNAVSSAVGWLRADGTNLVGALYTMVDQKSQAYNSYYYYSNKYTDYYEGPSTKG